MTREEKRQAEAKELTKVRQYATAPIASEPVEAEDEESSLEAAMALKAKLETLGVGSIVLHKKFGSGEIVKMDKKEKFRPKGDCPWRADAAA